MAVSGCFKVATALFSALLLSLFGLSISWSQVPLGPVRGPDGDAAAIKAASTLDRDAGDMLAVQQVCTACHSSTQFLSTPRSWIRWEQVFAEMSRYGANPSDEQIDRITRYFQRNLTVVNVNTSPLDQLAPTLQVDQATAIAIASLREQKKFTGIDGLAKLAGVDKEILIALRSRIQF